MAGAPTFWDWKPPQGDGDSWYSGSWLDQAIGGMGDLGRDAWGGINDLGEQWFGGGPGDFSGQVETARQYSEDTANEYENMIRNPIGYAKQNPSATLASLAGLAVGGGGAASAALRGASRAGSTAIPSRLPRDFMSEGTRRRVQAIDDEMAAERFAEDGPQPRFVDTGRIEDFMSESSRRRMEAIDEEMRAERFAEDGPQPRFGGMRRLLEEDRGGSTPYEDWPRGKWARGEMRGDPTDSTDLFNRTIDEYVNKKQPEAGDLDDMSPEGRGLRALFQKTFLNEEGMQTPKITAKQAAAEAAADRQLKGIRGLMENVDNTGHTTPMNAQGGAGVMAIRQGRRAGGEGNPHSRIPDPDDRGRIETGGARRQEYVKPSKQKKNPLRRNPAYNERINNVDEAVDVDRALPSEGVESGGPASYDRVPNENDFPNRAESLVAQGYSGGIRDVKGNPGPRPALADLFEHETDVGNIDSIRERGIEARWDKAEGDTPRRLVSARRKGGDSEVPEGRARIIFRSDQTPMERGGLSAVKFREGIRPEDIVDIIQAKKSTLGRLAEDTRRSGRELDPDFETKPKPSPSPPRKSKAKPPTPQVPPAKNTSGPTPAQLRSQRR